MFKLKSSFFRRGINAIGIILVSYGSTQAARSYERVRSYAMHSMTENKVDDAYTETILSTPETIQLYLILIFLGFLLIFINEHIIQFFAGLMKKS